MGIEWVKIETKKLEKMNLDRLNKLIKRIEFVSEYLMKNGNDPLLSESLEDYKEEMKSEFGAFLQDKLFDIYDEYFEDNEMLKLEEYIGKGVEVYGDEFEKDMVYLNMKPSPIRFEIHNSQDSYSSILWQAA